MSSDDGSQSFWTGLSGMLTGLVVLLTAGACLLFVLLRTGAFGDDDSGTAAPATDAPTSPSASSVTTSASAPTNEPVSTGSTGSTGSTSSATEDVGAALAGTWSGSVASSDGEFDVVLTIEPTCALRKPCGSIHVSSLPCTGRVRLWKVKDTTLDFYVDRFSTDSSPDCSPGAGELFEQVDGDHLRYSTEYSDATGLLQRG